MKDMLLGSLTGLVFIVIIVIAITVPLYISSINRPCDIQQATVSCVDGRLNVRLKDGFYTELVDDELLPIICLTGVDLSKANRTNIKR
jgi:hypothetical protein